MRSPLVALAWQFWGRHRFGLSLLVGYLLLLSILCPFVPASMPAEGVSTLMSVPFVFFLLYLTAVFTYGWEINITPARSAFPAWMFTVPVSTAQLIVCPILLGIGTVVLSWIVFAVAVLHPLGVAVPVLWPALVLAAAVVWLQALVWMPAGIPWARFVLAILAFTAVAVILIDLHDNRQGRAFQQAWFAPLLLGIILLGILVSGLGVALGRRGSGEWEAPALLVWATLQLSRWQGGAFLAPARAQSWLEWRRFGLPFVLLSFFSSAVFIAPFVLAAQYMHFLLWLAPELSALSARIWIRPELLLLFLFPLLLAMTAAGGLGERHFARRHLGLSPFLAALPLSSSAMVGAKLKAAAWSTLLVWIIPLLALWQVPWQWHFSPWLVPLLLVLVILTWRILVENLYLMLTGNYWIIQISSLLWMFFFIVACIGMRVVYSYPEHQDFLLELLPWAMGLGVVLKLILTYFALRALLRRRLLDSRTLARLALLWLAVALSLFSTIALFLDLPMIHVAFFVILLLPSARIALAPLTLARNRHC